MYVYTILFVINYILITFHSSNLIRKTMEAMKTYFRVCEDQRCIRRD